MPRLLLLGAGFGGLEALAEVKKMLDAMDAETRATWSITVVEKGEFWIGGLAMQFIVTKRKTPEECKRYYKDCVYRDFVTWVQDEVVKIDPEKRSVFCKQQEEPIQYDHLIIALGAPANHIPLVKDKIIDICSLHQTSELSERIYSITRGTVVVTPTRLPYRCPPVPFEFALIIDEILTERGVRDDVEIVLAFPKHAAVPVVCPQAVSEDLDKHNIKFYPGIQPKTISATDDGRHIVSWMPHPKFNPEGKVCLVPEPITADLLLGMLPHKAVSVLEPFTNEKGFVPVDTFTLRTKYDSVYCIGDCAWLTIPTKPKPRGHPKAGGFAEGQARIAVRNIFSGAAWDQPAPYRQDASCKAVCAMESGLNSLILLSINLHEVEGQPQFSTSRDVDPDYKVKWWNSRLIKHFNKGLNLE